MVTILVEMNGDMAGQNTELLSREISSLHREIRGMKEKVADLEKQYQAEIRIKDAKIENLKNEIRQLEMKDQPLKYD
ncbi:hypothetical protein SLU01_01490 [Sporosarcina luteola]|uniref:Uncharacterized protein n=1 Tax=Sporosarcina luteola TaxID=582850 RepID=A0A511Z356_9BACL|nr:hypothetical protein [Sporosarcina luteola]GEN81837.1 hypothetical protein SLU01_01490 [Sporosarcina luteola]